uniref:RING-type domain-containing protein n=1 Tax=Globodera pallida TaxID=36090 RepID=A0A183C359_GLOPA
MSQDQQKTDCSICLHEFEQSEELKILQNCNHNFHSECVDKWLKENPTCPVCRSYVLNLPRDHHASQRMVDTPVFNDFRGSF